LPRQISPPQADAQDIRHRAEHQPVVFGRTTPPGHYAIRPSARFSRRIRSILSAALSATPESNNDLNRTCLPSDLPCRVRFPHFENPP
jgi:hypothetical protein